MALSTSCLLRVLPCSGPDLRGGTARPHRPAVDSQYSNPDLLWFQEGAEALNSWIRKTLDTLRIKIASLPPCFKEGQDSFWDPTLSELKWPEDRLVRSLLKKRRLMRGSNGGQGGSGERACGR